jgi:hypothetical protein
MVFRDQRVRALNHVVPRGRELDEGGLRRGLRGARLGRGLVEERQILIVGGLEGVEASAVVLAKHRALIVGRNLVEGTQGIRQAIEVVLHTGRVRVQENGPF